jgi:hypothetical protein
MRSRLTRRLGGRREPSRPRRTWPPSPATDASRAWLPNGSMRPTNRVAAAAPGSSKASPPRATDGHRLAPPSRTRARRVLVARREPDGTSPPRRWRPIRPQRPPARPATRRTAATRAAGPPTLARATCARCSRSTSTPTAPAGPPARRRAAQRGAGNEPTDILDSSLATLQTRRPTDTAIGSAEGSHVGHRPEPQPASEQQCLFDASPAPLATKIRPTARIFAMGDCWARTTYSRLA